MDLIEQGGQWDCTTAEDLLDLLSLRRDPWRPQPAAWLFRGQPGDFELLPKAYRENGEKFREWGVACHVRAGADKPAANAYISSLTQMMMRFQSALDNAGLSIPGPAPSLFEPIPGTETKVPLHAKPLTAFAQHLGLPTPLLDWTTRPFVAAYFALPKESSKDPMVIWAIRQDFLPTTEELAEIGFDIKAAFMRIETAPRSSNPNLHAQSGLFTLIEGHQASEYTVDRYMAKVAEMMIQQVGHNNAFQYPYMRKLTLPGSEAKKLQQLLEEEGITAASMFPGPEGVIKALKERAVWSRT